MPIYDVKMQRKSFKGQRTAYSSDSIFVAILSRQGTTYDSEAIGELIFPDGFGQVEPPGPSFGFGEIFLAESEQNGVVPISSLDNRLNEEGKKVTRAEVVNSLESYIDAFFLVEEDANIIRQIEWNAFQGYLAGDSNYDFLHLVEYEPD